MALDRAQISEEEVQSVLGPDPLGEPTEEMLPPDAPAPRGSSSTLPTLLAAVGCLVLVGVTALTFAALVGLAMLVMSS